MAKLSPNLPPVSINLLQQTPSDRLLGDVLLANAAVCRLTEFKREGKLTRKELNKLNILWEGIKNSDTPEQYQRLSRQIHWYVEIQEPKILGQPVVSRACPYLDFLGSPDFISINQFAAAAAHEACQDGVRPGEGALRQRYIKWVCEQFAEIERQERADNGKRGLKTSTSSVFMVSISREAETTWMAVPSIEYAFMDHYELSRELGLQMERGIPKYKQERDRSYEREIEF